MTAPRAELLVDTRAELAEGPIWVDDGEFVAWTDIPTGAIWATELDGSTRPLCQFERPVGALALADDGSIVAATPLGLETVEDDPSTIATFPDVVSGLRMNDGKPDPAGRFVGGTMAYPDPIAGQGALWSFDSDRPRILVDGVTISNGVCWSADGSTMFYIDTPTQRVDAFDYHLSTGEVSNRRTVVRIDESSGAPDGMAIDVDGGLWIALWGGASVRRYEQGVVTEVIGFPTPFVTCPVFAGPQLDTLVVTTAAQPFGASPPAGAGAVYSASPGTSGLPANRYSRPE